MGTDFKYIIVDDDPFNTTISSLILNDALREPDLRAFTEPREALAYIGTEVRGPTVLFLDINMPTLTGWEFLEQFGRFPKKWKKLISIYMLSSSVDRRDKERARANKDVSGFISKPLEFETVIAIAAGEFKREGPE